MQKKPDRRTRRTKAQLRHGLAQLMAEKSVNEVTVKELVDMVDINRSTFYLHYTDIYHMLESVENELFEEILHTIRAHPVSPFNENSFPFIEDIFSILFAQDYDWIISYRTCEFWVWYHKLRKSYCRGAGRLPVCGFSADVQHGRSDG